MAKYLAGLDHVQPIEEANLVNDLNANTNTFIQQIAEQTITMVKNDELVFPVNASALSFLRKIKKQDFKIAYIAVGISSRQYHYQTYAGAIWCRCVFLQL